MKTSHMFVLTLLAFLMAVPVASAQVPAGPFCCGSPWGPYYPDYISCSIGCWDGCGPCDFSAFGYDCAGQYGYQYTCNNDNDETDQTLDVSVDSSCNGTIVTVESDGDGESNAHVSVKDVATGELIASGNTDSDGEFTFDGCGMKVDVKATKSGFPSETETTNLVDCGECETPECTDNTQCPDNEQCVNEECGPVPCECGQVKDHQCVEYACCSDSDCASTENCVNHICQKKETHECTSDAQCADSKYCDKPAGAAGGSCKDVQAGACGEVSNHTFVAFGYECGTEEGCPSCAQGYSCVEHKCVKNDVTCPSTGIVGASADCAATENEQPCADCDIVITDPTGKNSTGKTDGNGNFQLPLTIQGTYNVSLLDKDGNVVKIIQVKAFPQAQPTEPEKPTAAGPDFLSFAWIIGLLLVFVLLIIYWRGRAGKK